MKTRRTPRAATASVPESQPSQLEEDLEFNADIERLLNPPKGKKGKGKGTSRVQSQSELELAATQPAEFELAATQPAELAATQLAEPAELEAAEPAELEVAEPVEPAELEVAEPAELEVAEPAEEPADLTTDQLVDQLMSSFHDEESPVMSLSLETIAADARVVLGKLSREEYTEVTLKQALALMETHYGFPVRQRKADFKAAFEAFTYPDVPTMSTFKQAVITGSFDTLWTHQVAPLISSEKAALVGQATFNLVQREVEAEQQALQHRAAMSQLKSALVSGLWNEEQKQAEIVYQKAEEGAHPDKIEASLARVKESFTHEYNAHMTEEDKEAAVAMQRARNTKVVQDALTAASAELQRAKKIQSLLATMGLPVKFANAAASTLTSGSNKRPRAPAGSKKPKQSNSVRPPVFKGRTAEMVVKLDHAIQVEAHAALLKVVEANPDLGVYTQRFCKCTECSTGATDHGFNHSAKHAVLIFGLKDTEETEFAWRVEIVEHSVNCALSQNGPEPLGENSVRVDRHYFDDGPVSSNTKSKMHALYVEMGLPENSNWTIKQRSNKDPELVALKKKYHDLTDEEEKSKVKDEIVSRYLVLAKEEGYLNQHVIYQLPCDDEGTPDPNAKFFVMIPAACYYPGLELDQTLFPGFKMTCTQGNKSRLTQVPCEKLFGKYGYYEGVQPVTEFLYKGKWKGAWPTMWYKDLDAPDRAEKSTIIAHFTAAAAIPPGEPGHLSNVPSKEELQKLDLDVLQSLKAAVTANPAVDAFPLIEQVADGEPGPSKRSKV